MKTRIMVIGALGAAIALVWGQDGAQKEITEGVRQSLVNTSAAAPLVWKSAVPPDSPFEASPLGTNLYFTGRHANYTGADTWYPSWASDGHLYSPWTDGRIGSEHIGSWGGANARTGHARIEGDDPLDLAVVSLGSIRASALPYGGRYPCGSLVHDGIWYYGTYGLNGTTYGGFNWPILGPFPGFRISRDFGKTWEETPHTCEPGKALFPEPAELNGPVKIGAPHFVDFGKNMEHSPDGKAYLIGHGATQKDQEDRKANLSWISGDHIYLCRVVPSPETINDEAAYEYFAGRDAQGRPVWSDDFEEIKPVVDWNNNTGCVTMTYNAPLKKYIMCVTDGWPTVRTMRTYLLESDEITGPFRMVTYMADFGPQAYFVNIPSKFIGGDGRTFWLCYSANFTDSKRRHDPTWTTPYGSTYSLTLQEVRLLEPGEEAPETPEASADDVQTGGNLAPRATVTASSSHDGYSPAGAVDGKRGGYPGDIREEWASAGETVGAKIRLSWDSLQIISRVLLFDRPNPLDQVASGRLIFDDGTYVATGELPNDAIRGLEIVFPPKKTRWIEFEVTGVKPGGLNSGLSEIYVFE